MLKSRLHKTHEGFIINFNELSPVKVLPKETPGIGVTPYEQLRLRRKLHVGHFAFMRSLAEGLPLHQSWHRYLYIEGEPGQPTVRKTLRWLKEELAITARREKRYGIARLMLLDLQPAVGQGSNVDERPTMEAFAESIGAEDFSYDDLIELYTERYGAPTREENRRARLLKKQLEALRWLESLVAVPPHINDRVSAWFNDSLSRYLKAARIYTLRDLIDRINGKGFRWWSGIRGIAQVKAQRLMRWVDEYALSLGKAIGQHVTTPRHLLPGDATATVTRPTTDIVPLEKFIVPKELDGSIGVYRAPAHLCLMAASNDHQALLTWINSKASPNTQRAYRKEAERLLLWAILIRRKPLSSLTLEDCNAYVKFMDDPQPSAEWCGTRARERWSPLWRPFEGPMKQRAKLQAIRILKSLYKFLVSQCYLVGNPWTGVPVPKGTEIKIDVGRSLTFAQWTIVEKELASLPPCAMTSRLRFAIGFLYGTGLRLSEIVKAKVGDLEYHYYPPDAHSDEAVEGWTLHVVGKGGKARDVPVPTEIVTELEKYLVSRELPGDVNHPDNQDAFILGRSTDIAEVAPWSKSGMTEFNPKAGISASTLYDHLKKFFQQCADSLPSEEHKTAVRFEAASTHWLRHTFGSHMTAKQVDTSTLQLILGHANLSTTGIYSTSEEKRRMQAVQNFWRSRAI